MARLVDDLLTLARGLDHGEALAHVAGQSAQTGSVQPSN